MLRDWRTSKCKQRKADGEDLRAARVLADDWVAQK